MYYYKSKIQYDGTNYTGLQWQSDLPTIQREFNLALTQVSPGKISTMSASRTDTGVHAVTQFMKITSEIPLPLVNLNELLNNYLPDDIRCLEIEICPSSFRPVLDARSKEYRYYFTNKIIVKKEDTRFISNISKPLNISKIENLTEFLRGNHDFKNFYSRGNLTQNTFRNIYSCELSKVDPREIFKKHSMFKIPLHLEECFEFKISGDGFLKQMIRHLIAGLWHVGTGKLSKEEFLKILNGQKLEQQPWKVAPPNGLFLFQIDY